MFAFGLSGCLESNVQIASVAATWAGKTNNYYAYTPPSRGSDRRPTCGWRGGRHATAEGGKVLETYAAIVLACGFDVSDEKRIESKLSLVLEFQRSEGRDFKAVKTIILTSENGLILKSNLMKGRPANWRCREEGCGIIFNILKLPDPFARTGSLEFDFTVSAPLTYNLSDKTVYQAEFHFKGKAPRHWPY